MRAYFRTFLLSFLAALAAVAGLTRLIDPYGYWGGPEIAGLNSFKPASGKHLKAVKLRQVARVRPATLLVGNSRVAVGMDPEDPAWPAPGRTRSIASTAASTRPSGPTPGRPRL